MLAAMMMLLMTTAALAGCAGSDVTQDDVDAAYDNGYAAGTADAASVSTLDTIIARGSLKCGVKDSQFGMGYLNADGTYSGLDIEYCKAVAAAIGIDNIEYILATGSNRFELLASAEIDVLIRTTTWTTSRDAGLNADFAGMNFYDGQGMLVNLAQFAGATSALDLDGANICVGIGTTTEGNLLDYYDLHGMTMTTINTENAAAAQENFLDGSCGVWVGTIGALSQRLYGLRDEGMDLRLMTANLFWDYRWVEIYSVFDIEITQEEETAISFISVDAYTNLRAVCSINCTGIDADIELDVRYRTSTHSISCNNGEWQDESIRDEFSNYSAFRGEGLNCQHHFSYNASTYFSDLNDVDLDRYVLEWSDWHYFIVWEENTVIVES